MSRPSRRPAVVLPAAVVAVVALAGPAAAHVSVSSSDAAPGAFGKLTFRVPNESDTASTVALRIQIPEEAAMASLRAMDVPGWTVTMTTERPAELLESHGQEVSEYVSVVEFRADDDAAGLGPGEFGEFSLAGGRFPDLDEVAYPVVQTYSDGAESAWIEPTLGDDQPEFPAPVLMLTAGSGTDAAAEQPSAPSDDDDSGRATAALVVAVLALAAGVGGLALGWAARRRTVAG